MLYNQEHTDLCKNIRFLYFRKIKSNSIQCSLLIHRLLLLKFISNWWIHIGAPEVWISLNSEWRGIDSNYKQRPTNLACISEERKSYTNCNPGKKKPHTQKSTTKKPQQQPNKQKTKPNPTKQKTLTNHGCWKTRINYILFCQKMKLCCSTFLWLIMTLNTT